MTLARTAGLFYLLTFAFGVAAVLLPAGRDTANAIAGASYVVVTALFYLLFKGVDRVVSFIAALFSLGGCAAGVLAAFHVHVPVNPLTFFGVYCLFIGLLIHRSAFLPRWLGVLMIGAGVSWLTFGWPLLGKALSPFNMLPGVIAEGTLTGWLLFARVSPESTRPELVA